MANTKSGFGVVRSRGLFSTSPDTIHVVEGTFSQAGEGEVAEDGFTKPEPGAWYLQAAYPQNLWAVDEDHLILPTREEAEAARLNYVAELIEGVNYEIESLAGRSRRLAANLTRSATATSVGP